MEGRAVEEEVAVAGRQAACRLSPCYGESAGSDPAVGLGGGLRRLSGNDGAGRKLQILGSDARRPRGTRAVGSRVGLGRRLGVGLTCASIGHGAVEGAAGVYLRSEGGVGAFSSSA